MNIFFKILLILFILLVGIIMFFLIRFQIWKIKENKRGWRTRSLGRDSICYDEKVNNEWKRIEISGEMLKVLYFKNENKWTEYPEWAHNREEIIKRVKLDYPPEQTDYENN